MFILMIFLIRWPTWASAFEFKCNSPNSDQIIMVHCAKSCERYTSHSYRYSYGYYTDDFYFKDYQGNQCYSCHKYNNFNQKEIRFQNCSDYELPSAALQEIGYYSVHSLNIAQHDRSVLNASFFLALNGLEKLFANHNEFKELPDNIFASTQLNLLDLSYNQFDEIESIGRSGAKNLKTLNISNNKINEIGEKSFRGLIHLETLDVSFNNLTELNVEAFGVLVELEYLFLAHINISHIEFGSFSIMKNLRSIDLCGNHIQKIAIIQSQQPIMFPHLQSMNLSSNEIIEMNGFDPSELPTLTYLDLRFNNFNCSHLKSVMVLLSQTRFPREQSLILEQAYEGLACSPSPLDQGRKNFQCTKKDDIVLVTCGKFFQRHIEKRDYYGRSHYYNQFDYNGFYYEYYSNCDTMPESFIRTGSPHIEIQFENCSMSDLPIEALNQMSDARVSTVDISKLGGFALNSTFFSGLIFLEKLTANHNKLQGFEKNVFINTALKYLDLAYNEFTNVESIGKSGVNGLKALNISHNKIEQINATSFEGLDRLDELNLSFNDLKTIGDETFDMLCNLTSLSMAHTHLLHIDFGLLSHLENLQSLDISQSEIRTIEIGIHSAIFMNLQTINMRGSEILEINGLTQTTFPNLIRLDLRSNRINCSHLQTILSSFDSHRLRLKKDPSSKIKKDKSIRGIACDQFTDVKPTLSPIQHTLSPKKEYSTSTLSSKWVEKTTTTGYETESNFPALESNEMSSSHSETESTLLAIDENGTTINEETTTAAVAAAASTTIPPITTTITDAVVGSLAVVGNDHYKFNQIHETLQVMKVMITLLSITLILTIVCIIVYANQKSISNRLRNAYVVRFRRNSSNNDENDENDLVMQL